jgi:prophage DNA circulation protein
MRDWRSTLRPASYKGAAFFVDEEALPKSGRFVARHTFVKAETHSTEDMGRLPREFRVSAYFASDTADSDLRSFVELCSEAGAGTLVLPMLGSYQVRCCGCHVKAKKDRLGYVELELDFFEAGNADDSFPATALGDRLAAAQLEQLPDTASQALSDADTQLRDEAAMKAPFQVSNNAGFETVDFGTYMGSKTDQSARDDAFSQAFG